MWEPPPGFKDLLGDADRWTPSVDDAFEELEVPIVGVIHARRPRPVSVAKLSMVNNRKVKPEDQKRYFDSFVIDHIGQDEFERIALELMMSTTNYEVDALQRIARAVATWGTARPYAAVVTLSLYTGHNWRAVRSKLLLSGIVDPMGLPSLHSILDVTEDIVVSALSRAGDKKEGPPSEGELAIKRFYDAIYRPDPEDHFEEEDEDDEPVVPIGFDDPDSIEDTFDSFMGMGR